METWNERLAAVLDKSGYSKTGLAAELGVSVPTISAWVGAGATTPTTDIMARHLFDLSKAIGVRPEWLLFGDGDQTTPPSPWPFACTLDQYMGLNQEDRAEIEALINLKIVLQAAKS